MFSILELLFYFLAVMNEKSISCIPKAQAILEGAINFPFFLLSYQLSPSVRDMAISRFFRIYETPRETFWIFAYKFVPRLFLIGIQQIRHPFCM